MLECRLVEKTSAKGNKYIALEITITENYKKIVFLDPSEIELIKIASQKR